MPHLRLDDLAAPWRSHSTSLSRELAEALSAELRKSLPDNVDEQELELKLRITADLQDTALHRAREIVVPAALGWLRQNSTFSDHAVNSHRSNAELMASLQSLPRLELKLPMPTLSLPMWAWPWLAALGASLGGLAFGALLRFLGKEPDIGILLGGIAGAAGLVALVASLSQRPNFIGYLSLALGISGTVLGIGGLWRTIRGQYTSLLKSSALFLFAAVILYACRPKKVLPTRQACVDAVQGQLQCYAAHTVDWVLALCCLHAEGGQTEQARIVEGDRQALPDSVFDALTVVRATLSINQDGLRDAVVSFVQRVEEEGFAWKSLIPGTAFLDDMRQQFDTFGLVATGDPVETLEPAVLRGATAIRRGTVRKLRTPEGAHG